MLETTDRIIVMEGRGAFRSNSATLALTTGCLTPFKDASVINNAKARKSPKLAESWICNMMNSTGDVTMTLTSSGSRCSSIIHFMMLLAIGKPAIKPAKKRPNRANALFRRWILTEERSSPPGESISSDTASSREVLDAMYSPRDASQ